MSAPELSASVKPGDCEQFLIDHASDMARFAPAAFESLCQIARLLEERELACNAARAASTRSSTRAA